MRTPAPTRSPARRCTPSDWSTCRTSWRARSQVIDPDTRHGHRARPGRPSSPEHVVPVVGPDHAVGQQRHGQRPHPHRPATGQVGRPVAVRDPYNLYFTPDGKHALVMAERLRAIDVRDPHTMKLMRSLPVPCAGINHADFTADLTHIRRQLRVQRPAARRRRAAPPSREGHRPQPHEDAGRDAPERPMSMGGPRTSSPPGASAMPQDVRLDPRRPMVPGRRHAAQRRVGHRRARPSRTTTSSTPAWAPTASTPPGTPPRSSSPTATRARVSVLDAATLTDRRRRGSSPAAAPPTWAASPPTAPSCGCPGATTRASTSSTPRRSPHRADPRRRGPPRAARLAPARPFLARPHREHAMTTAASARQVGRRPQR